MTVIIITELTKTDENTHVTRKQVSTWTKRNEAQRALEAVIISLSEVKEFDKIQTVRDYQKQNGIKLHTPVKMPKGKNANMLIQAINPDNAQNMGRNAQGATR